METDGMQVVLSAINRHNQTNKGNSTDTQASVWW
jgi:hypothetical protein